MVPQPLVLAPDGPCARRSSSAAGAWSPPTTSSARWCSPATGLAEPLFCDNDTNTARLWHSPGPEYPKDGINDHVVGGAPTVNPARTGTKAALRYRLDVAAGETAEVRLRLAPDAPRRRPGLVVDGQSPRRRRPTRSTRRWRPPRPADEALVMRQAFAGMLWSKQFYNYDVTRWLDGDPGLPPPPPSRLSGRNSAWRHAFNRDIISMPDKWEYPWYAAWDLAFHCVTLAHVDPEFAKQQLRLITREWYMNPNGQLPAYEWDFGDVNPPVHALAALAVFRLDGERDRTWLVRMFHKLLLGFTWWANVKDPQGDHLFGGGFLGMDNVGPVRPLQAARARTRARAGRRHRVDGALLPEHARDRDRARLRGPRLRGRRSQVLRALRADR